jgi:serine/threonine protein phosphatase PrpC
LNGIFHAPGVAEGREAWLGRARGGGDAARPQSVGSMLLSPAAEESPMLRLSQQTEDALMLMSPAARSPLSPQRGQSTGPARNLHDADLAGSPAMRSMRDEEGLHAAPLDRARNDDACDIAHLSTAVKVVHAQPPAVGMCANWTGKKEEDRAFVEGDGRVMAVFDGHLGPALSQFAADAFPAALRKAALDAGVAWEGSSAGWARVESPQAAQAILGTAFRNCHEEARRLRKRGGTTALVFWSCLVDGRRTGFCANAGDSRAVLRCGPHPESRLPASGPDFVVLARCRSALMCLFARGLVCSCDGTAQRLSVDHTAKEPDEIKRVQSVGGAVFLGCLADPRDGDAEITVTRGLGNFNLEPGFTPQPHVCDPIDLSAPSSEFVVLASDGIWDMVTDQEAVTLARDKLLNGWSPQAVAQFLAETAEARGSKDDTSVIVFSISARLGSRV